MGIGIHFSYWAKNWIEDYHQYIEKAANLGFDVLEISCSGILALYQKREDLESLGLHAKERGLRLIAGYGPSKLQNLCSKNRDCFNSSLSFYKTIFPMLQALDIKILAGPLCCNGEKEFPQPVPKETDWIRAQENLLQIAPLAKDHGVTLAIEVVNRYEGYLLNTSKEAVQFVSEINHPNIQLLLDTFHMNIEEDDLCDALWHTGNHLKHIHVSEQNRRLPGQGHIPWTDFGNTLLSMGYQGDLVIESFVQSDGLIGHKAGVWRDLLPHLTEETLDNNAKASLSFLRHIMNKTSN